jgi:signal transduction histidine kinase
VGLTILAATLATCLFGIPLAVATAHYFTVDEQRELEHMADVTAVAVSGDLAKARNPADLPVHESGTQMTVYDATGARVGGPGAQPPAGIVRAALRGTVASGSLGGRIAAAVPVSDGDTVVGAVLVTSDHSQVYARIARTLAGMLGLANVAIGVAWVVARRLSRRIAGPVERLAVAAERLGDGDFGVRTAPAGIPEIDTASDSLNRTAERLGNLVDRERAFATDASHQLRTPLTGLQLGIESALETPDADLRSALSDALATARRLESTVTDLLALARHGPQGEHALDVHELTGEVREQWAGLFAEAGRPLRVAVERDLPPTFLSHAAAKQMLDVLVDNALSHGRGAVTVTARAAEGALAIDVSDEGPAIDVDPRELFRRRSANGTGIGLVLARRLAESEGGRLVLSSRQPPSFTVFAPGAGQGAADPPD